jgi:phosphoglycerol transferase MdoB-like AlkP superfamily enzyme/glycerophosphoryl diester phosphodiesterase
LPASGIVRTLAWALGFAVVTTALRIFVFSGSGRGSLGLDDVASFLLGLPEQLLYGTILALGLAAAKGAVRKLLMWFAVLLVTFLNLAAFHYEAIFDRLPTRAVFNYTEEVAELGPSLALNAPLPVIAIELLLPLGLLVVLWIVLSGRDRSLRGWGWPAIACLVLCVVAVCVQHIESARRPVRYPWRSRAPLTWLVESALVRDELSLDASQLGPQSVFFFQQALGHPTPFGRATLDAPLCSEGPRAGGDAPSKRSVILVILESVGSRELEAVHEGLPVMPALRRLASENLAFLDIKAAGTKSSHAMPALFSGLPPQPAGNPLHLTPLPRMSGFPRLLVRSGYRTVYLHGGDLSWEHQRQFLRMVGFSEIIERDPRRETPVYGWGYSDGEMLDRLRDWVEDHRRRSLDRPYLATLFTLSSHDPYALPPEWPGRFEGRDARTLQYESLAYLDDELDSFLEWFREFESPRGTFLVLVGDHTPHLLNTEHTPQGPVYRLELPLVIVGLEGDELADARSLRGRRGAQYDIPATTMELLGLPPSACDQGVSLLADPEGWPEDRIVYSVGGEDQHEIQLWSGPDHLAVDLSYGHYRRLAPRLAGRAADAPSARVKRFVEILLPLSGYLLSANAIAPTEEVMRPEERARLPQVELPFFVAHRGNTDGPSGGAAENTLEALGRAERAGLGWVEVDVRLTADGIPVLHHDPAVGLPGEGKVPIRALSLDELRSKLPHVPTLEEALESFPELNFVVEQKPYRGYAIASVAADAVSELVRRHRRDRVLMIDSFSLLQAASSKTSCDCEVGWDLPHRQAVDDEMLDAAVMAGLDWVFVDRSVVTKQTIREAHARGLRVMVYTVNDPGPLLRLESELPDGVITDHADLEREFLAGR